MMSTTITDPITVTILCDAWQWDRSFCRCCFFLFLFCFLCVFERGSRSFPPFSAFRSWFGLSATWRCFPRPTRTEVRPPKWCQSASRDCQHCSLSLCSRMERGRCRLIRSLTFSLFSFALINNFKKCFRWQVRKNLISWRYFGGKLQKTGEIISGNSPVEAWCGFLVPMLCIKINKFHKHSCRD